MDLNFDETDNEGPEDLVEILKKTEENFRFGNDSQSNYYFSPKQRLDDYTEFE
jgi:hypothetical protein